jgi:hypothetical protein
MHLPDNRAIKATPWACVGGCGAGGSGGAGGATAKWIGRGVSGGLLDIQGMYSSTATKKSDINGLELRFSMKPSYTSVLALTVPFLSKNGSMQPTTAVDEKIRINNGLGDIRLDYQSAFGLQGEFSYNFMVTVPTGSYTEKTGTESSEYLPTSLQLGTGLCNLSLDLGYTLDRDKSMVLIDAIYSYPFAVNFSGKSKNIPASVSQEWDLLTTAQQKRFNYYFKPYGENDIGGYTPPSITTSVFYGYKGMEDFVHSFGLMYSVPLGVAWIPDYRVTSYHPTPDPDNQVWSATLCYGLEFSRANYPIFVAAYLPIHAKTASATNAQASDPFNTKIMSDWSRGPDWNDIFHRWSIFMGVKTYFF